MKFANVISDEVVAYVQKMKSADLGFDFDGETEALVFETTIEKNRNPFMFEQYAKGYVKQHSVCMRRVKMFLCINSTDKYYIEEKENWDKYIDEVANKDKALDNGYFWAIAEAQIIEGSAVLLGSNPITPTISVKNDEPLQDTRQDTQDSSLDNTIDAKELTNFILQTLKK